MVLFNITRLVASSSQNRSKVLEAVEQAAESSRSEEGTTIYALAVPRDDPEGTTLYVFEQYANAKALKHHQDSSFYRSLTEKFSSQPPLLEGTPVLIQAEALHTLTRREISEASDPYMVFGTVDYEAGGLDKTLSYWKDVFDTTEQNEEGALSYSLCRDVEDPTKLRTVEVFKSKEYLWSTHVKSDAVARNLKDTGHLRTGLKHVFLRIMGGYFVK